MTSFFLPETRRFLKMLWLSAALHLAVMGLTRLPPQQFLSQPLELQVELARPAGLMLPVPDLLPQPVRPVTSPVVLRTTSPQPVATPAPVALPQKAVVQASLSPASIPASSSIPSAASSVTLNTVTHNAPGPQINITQAVDTRYYQAKELDVMPRGLKGEPEMPPQAQDAGVGGRVELRLQLEVDGSISESEVVSVKPGGVFGELFKKSALAWVRGQRLQPALRGGRPVRAILIVPVVFSESEN